MSDVKNFLGNKKAENYKDIVETMLNEFHCLGSNTSIKLQFLNSHFDQFPENVDDVIDDQGKRFHQDKNYGGAIPRKVGHSYDS